MGIVSGIVILLRTFLLRRLVLAAENLALRQQLGVLQRLVRRSKLRRHDRIFRTWLLRLSACPVIRHTSRLGSCGIEVVRYTNIALDEKYPHLND